MGKGTVDHRRTIKIDKVPASSDAMEIHRGRGTKIEQGIRTTRTLVDVRDADK